MWRRYKRRKEYLKYQYLDKWLVIFAVSLNIWDVDVLIKKFRAPVYRNSVWVVVCDNIEKAIDKVEDMIHYRIVKQEDKKFVDAYTYAYTDTTVFNRVILFFTPNVTVGRLAHEAKHAINMIFNYHGVKLSYANDEHECYYLEDFVNQICRTIKKFHKKNFTSYL